MVTAQPGCDLEWFHALDEQKVQVLDADETLSLLEQRSYRWGCGCSQERMFSILGPIMRTDPAGLFGNEDTIRISCPRCGALHLVTRDSMEAFLAAVEQSSQLEG